MSAYPAPPSATPPNVWVKEIVPRDLPWVTRQAAKTQNTVKDDKAKKNPAVFSAAMAGLCASAGRLC